MTQNVVNYPEWERVEEAETWFLKLRKAVRSVVCAKVMGAKIIFEEAQKIRYEDYRNLKRVLHEARDFWFRFNGQGEITPPTRLSCASTPEQLPKCTG